MNFFFGISIISRLYHVLQYSSHWKIIRTFYFKALPVENRGQIVDDAFNLARLVITLLTLSFFKLFFSCSIIQFLLNFRAGIVDEVRALRTLEYMTDEREYLPWYTAMRTRLPYIKRMLYSTKAFADLQVVALIFTEVHFKCLLVDLKLVF